MRSKERSLLHHIDVQGDNASTDTEAATSSPEDPAKIINEGGYTKWQIVSAYKTIPYRKKMPFRTAIVREMLSFDASKNSLTLLIGANAAGELKWKPVLIDHSENPKILKNYANSTLSVLYKWNNKGWTTVNLFITLFTEHFKPTFET